MATKKHRSARKGSARKTARHGDAAAAAKRSKKPTNLTLDPEALARGERYGQLHGTSLSQLVSRFLHALPAPEADDPRPSLVPPVARLAGLAAGGTADRNAYREHLARKYGGR